MLDTIVEIEKNGDVTKTSITYPHNYSPEKFAYINAAQAVWITKDFVGASDLLWRWWSLELIDMEDMILFIDLRRKTSACLMDEEICAEEERVLQLLQDSIDDALENGE